MCVCVCVCEWCTDRLPIMGSRTRALFHVIELQLMHENGFTFSAVLHGTAINGGGGGGCFHFMTQVLVIREEKKKNFQREGPQYI